MHVEYTPAKRDRLRAAYEAEVTSGKTDQNSFMFEGHEYVLGYARYMLEYLDGVFAGGA